MQHNCPHMFIASLCTFRFNEFWELCQDMALSLRYVSAIACCPILVQSLVVELSEISRFHVQVRGRSKLY